MPRSVNVCPKNRVRYTFGCERYGDGKPMQAATNDQGLTIINFGIGSPNAATIMDLLSARQPRGVLFLGKCGGLKRSTEIGHFILPIAAIRGEGISDDYFPPQPQPSHLPRSRRGSDLACGRETVGIGYK